MVKKFPSNDLKVITLAITSALCAMSMHVQASEWRIDSDTPLLLIKEASSESNGRFVGIESNTSDPNVVVNITEGSTLTIKNDSSTPSNPNRLYGIASQAGSSLDINGNLSIKIDSDTEIRGIRGNGGDITLNGDLDVTLSSASGDIYGLDAWSSENGSDYSDIKLLGSKAHFDITGKENKKVFGMYADSGTINSSLDTLQMDIQTDRGQISAIRVLNGSVVDFSPTDITLNIHSIGDVYKVGDNRYLVGFENRPKNPSDDSQRTVLSLNNATVNFTVTGKYDVEEDSTRFIQAINAAGSTTIVKGDFNTNIYGQDEEGNLVDLGETEIRAINLEGSAYNTSAQFEKDINIVVNSQTKDVIGVYSSGDDQSTNDQHSSVSVLGTINVDISGKNQTVKALVAQGKSEISTSRADINIQSDLEDAQVCGILSGLNRKNEGHVFVQNGSEIQIHGQGTMYGVSANGSSSDQSATVNLGGTNIITVASENKDAYGIVSSENAQVTVSNAKVNVTSQSGQAFGIQASQGQASIVLTGSNQVSATGEQSVGVDLQDGNLEVSGSLSALGEVAGIRMDSGSTTTLKTGSTVVANTMQSQGKTVMNADSTLSVTGGKDSQSSLGTIDADSSNLSVGEGQYAIDELTGNSMTLMLSHEDTDVTIAKNGSDGLKLQASGDLNDALHGNAEAFTEMVTFTNPAEAEGVAYLMQEGMYEGEQFGTYGENGKITTRTVKVNSLMQSTLELASAAPLAMNRIMMSDLRKRMGDIRTDTNTNGAWARYEGGRLSGSNGLENDFNTIQVGGDTKLGNWRVGGAFNYTTGDADYARGDAEMDAYGLSAYGLWLGEQGQFVDIVARVSKADTDMKVDGYKKGSMDSMAYSLSGEFGWRFALSDMVYFEPQVEAAYTYVDADDLDIGNASYKFDSVNSLIGRAGFATGIKCPSDFGDVYFHASALHEFSGDTEITGGNGSKYSVDGKDTWFEYGIGANFNINKATYVWVDVQRTSGADLDEDWRANIGVRYSF